MTDLGTDPHDTPETAPAPTSTTIVDVSDQVSETYRWVALAVVLVGTLMVVLDTTIVNIALPAIRDDLGDGIGIEWVVTAYLLAVTVSMPASGWMADRFGRKNVLVASMACFTAASLIAAFAPTLNTLVFMRVVQGVGGGALLPVGMALVFEVFPPERRGQAMGSWGTVTMLGPAIGPTLGGWLITAVSWHWLFLVNVPIGIVAVSLAVFLLRDFGYREERPFDAWGFALAGSGLAILLLGVSESQRWGWSSPATLLCVFGGLLLLGWFSRHELRTPNPMIEVRIFRIPVFTIGLLITSFVTVAQFTRLVFIPLQLEELRGTTAFHVGLLLSPGAIAAGIAMLLSGRLVDRVGSRTPVVIGTSVMCLSVLAMANLTTHTPLWVISALLVGQGVGMGLSAVPSTVVALNSVPAKYVAQATAARTVCTQAAGAMGIGALAALVAARMTVGSAQAAYNTAFLASAALLVIAIVLGTRLPQRPERMGAASHGILPE